MKKILTSIFATTLVAAMVSISTGCASVNVSNQGPNMVTVENSGCFLLYCIPLFSGDPNYPNQDVCNWFENTVKVETNMRLLEEEMANQGARGIRNIASHQDDETVLFLLLKRKIYKTSAELIR